MHIANKRISISIKRIRKNTIDIKQFYSQLVSLSPVPMFGQWTLSIRVINLMNGPTIGLTDYPNINRKTSTRLKNTICFCASEASVYVNQVRKRSPSIVIKEGFVLQMVINRENGLFTLLVNGDKLESIRIPKELTRSRLYPFI